MGLLRKLFGDEDKLPERPWEHRPDWLTNGVALSLFGGSETLEVVGESSYQDGLDRVVNALRRPEHQDPRSDGGVRIPAYAVLVAEYNNPYDENAISVWVPGHKAGHCRVGSRRITGRG